ncbi:MAG: hypothetical protein IJI22_04070 [Bacilli bacterium]|nr:hypothetical protein [Bacilli bacterium]
MSRHKKKKKTNDINKENISNNLDSLDKMVDIKNLEETISSEDLAKEIMTKLDELDANSDEIERPLEEVSLDNNDDDIEMLSTEKNVEAEDVISDIEEETTSLVEDAPVENVVDKDENVSTDVLDNVKENDSLDVEIDDNKDSVETETTPLVEDAPVENVVDKDESVSTDVLDNGKENDNLNVEIDDNKDSVEKETKKDDADKHLSNSGKYISYEYRVGKIALLLLLSIGLAVFFILKSFSVINTDSINYSEKSNLDYKVYLKSNNFYEKDYLGKDMLYVANLIDHINVDFDYKFTLDKMVDVDLTYDIIAKLKITDVTEKDLFFEKDYVLQEPVTEKIGNSTEHTINKSLNIDYNYYNALANNFRTSYGLDTKSSLLVYFRVRQDNGKYEVKYPINGNSEMLINIPLTEKAISVKLDYKEVNDSNQVVAAEHLAITNYFFVILAIICLGAVVYFIIKLVRLLKSVMVKKSSYDKYVSRILKEYDRLIVETETAPLINDNTNVIKVSKFQELLDVRDNLKLPIKYYIVNEHQKCDFFISHEEELYLLTIKEVDLENDKKES